MTLKQQFLEAIENTEIPAHIPKHLYIPAATACEVITKSKMGEFAEWTHMNGWEFFKLYNGWKYFKDAHEDGAYKRTPDLLELFLNKEGSP